MSYIDLDDIIYSIQSFGGATTYWRELTSRLHMFIPGDINHISANKFERLISPSSSAKIFHSSHFRISSSSKVKNVTTIHDLIYEKGLGGGIAKFVNLFERRRSVLHADAIICISESTRRDLLEYYGKYLYSKPIYVVHHGCSNLITESLEKFDLFKKSQFSGCDFVNGNFFVFVGGRSGYKNFDVLVKAFASGMFAKQGLKIVCTGASFSRQELELIDGLNLSDFIISAGFLSPGALGALYGVARALVYPSTYEGFGLPPLEAMSLGCPVICSNSSSLPEVVGDSGILVEPNSIEHLVMAMNSVLLDDVRLRYSSLGIERAGKFDWATSARLHASVYASLSEF